MKCGIIVPGGDPRTVAEVAAEAEAAGWDGVFVPDSIAIHLEGMAPFPAFDPWIVLAAIAMRTSRVTLGPILAALPRRRPWKVAREAMTLDHLSGGRLVMAVGLGAADDDAGFSRVGEPLDRATRAARLDESIALLRGFWSGEAVHHEGAQYRVDGVTLRPVPLRQIPIWVAAMLGRPRSMARVMRCDGVLPQAAERGLTFDDVRALRTEIGGRDIIVEGQTEGDASDVAQWRDAGASWWMETRWHTAPDGIDAALAALRQRAAAGPPIISNG